MDKTTDINQPKPPQMAIPAPLAPIIERMQEYLPNANLNPVIEAYLFAVEAHKDTKRLSGEPYINHSLAVADILSQLRMDISTVSAGLLHDVLEDTPVSYDAMAAKFGAEIATLVNGVTKISRYKFDDRQEREVESIRKMILAMAQDIRVIMIKLADRLHNMRTLMYQTPEKKIRIANNTMDIYAPIAHRLGIGRIKMELEDLSLRYLNPEMYEQLQVYVAKKRKEREEYTLLTQKTLEDKLKEMEIPAKIEGRAKHFYSIYHKMVTQKKNMDEIYDLTAIRVVTENLRDCYAVLGIVHTLWKPIQGRFKDYIAMPKSNMYQSLHTTVWGPNKEPVEIQIRTVEMHRIAAEGIAAHWLYKEGKSFSKEQFDQRFNWLRQLLELQQDTRDPKEFMDNLKIDLFTDEVFVFTPKGTVKELPVGATTVDFAFAVHTEVGLHCTGAKVNQSMVPLRKVLNTGDIVEIVTNKSAKPSRDWLSFVKTSRARNKIVHFLKQEESEAFIRDGKDELTRELKILHLGIQEVIKSDGFVKLVADLGFPSNEELFLGIGSGKVSAKTVINRLFPTKLKTQNYDALSEIPYTRSQEGIIIRGLSDVLIRFGKCCHPVMGDAIIGFVTRGRGISIHKRECPSIQPFLMDQERLVVVAWDNKSQTKHMVPIKIEGMDRPGLLRDVLDQIAVMSINVVYAKAEKPTKNKAQILVILEITDSLQLNELIKVLHNIPGVINVSRTNRVK